MRFGWGFSLIFINCVVTSVNVTRRSSLYDIFSRSLSRTIGVNVSNSPLLPYDITKFLAPILPPCLNITLETFTAV